jgi:Fuc2NAc and GlcNAc transferase
MTPGIWVFLLSFVLSVLGTGVSLLYSKRLSLIDIPNHRSSHTTPTPRGGGIAIVGSVLFVGAYALSRFETYLRPPLLLLATSLLGLTLVGWIDDHRSVSVGIRLLVHLICGAAVAILVNMISPMAGLFNIAWLTLWLVWTVGSINIVNFMDGIDGMIALQGIVFGAFIFALLPRDSAGSPFGLILAGACTGFLLWNWEPAKLFMGDVGSGPLGLLFVIGGALALSHARPVVVFLPLFPLFFDALLTLVRRFRRGEKLTDAHRSHLYQRIVNAGVRHSQVSFSYAVAAAVGAVVAVGANHVSPQHATIAIVCYLLAVLLVWTVADKRLAVNARRASVPHRLPR